MAILTRADAQALLNKVLSLSKADALAATLNGGRSANTRFGVNSANTSGDVENVSLAVSAQFGQRSGNATTNTLDDAGLERVVRAAEEIARLRPDDPEMMPFVGKQEYAEINGFDEATYTADAKTRASAISAVIEPSIKKNLVAAGIYEHQGGFAARANTKDNFGYSTNSLATYTTTVRTVDGTGSGWAAGISHRIREVDAKAIAERAVMKAELSRNPVQIEPGKYTVILEPDAVGDLVSRMMFSFGARQADEGRSFLGKKGGGNKIGEKVFGEKVNIYTDPALATAPGSPFDGQGLPTRRMDFVSEGVVKNLNYDRYWARNKGVEPNAFPGNIIIQGGNSSIEEMIKNTERGILVTRFWYIRPVDPQTVLFTGLTRDGTFLIEQGRLKSAIKNFRFNETPVKMLNLVEAMSPVQRIIGSERTGANIPVLAPAMKISEFEFTSLSEAV
jgi:predicted Zn-dependent protease